VDEVNEGIAGSSTAAEDITREIADVHTAAGNIDAGSRKTRQRVTDLETLTADLTRMTEMFRI